MVFLHLPQRRTRQPRKYGVYEITPFDLDADIWVAFGDGGERHVYIYRPGGDDYRQATLQKVFHLRVNAPNSSEAARLLREYLVVPEKV